jgi:hypothetical protein
MTTMAETPVSVKLTADVSEYVTAMDRASRATRRLAKAYRSLPRKARIIARLTLEKRRTSGTHTMSPELAEWVAAQRTH